MVNSRPYSNKSKFEGYLTILSSMAMSLLIFLPFIKMDTPSETSISWGPTISNALARIVLVLEFRSAVSVQSRHSKCAHYYNLTFGVSTSAYFLEHGLNTSHVYYTKVFGEGCCHVKSNQRLNQFYIQCYISHRFSP